MAGIGPIRPPPLVNTGVLEDWRIHIGLPLHMIRHTDVSDAMLSDVSGGTSFIRDFIVLFHACLIEPLQSGAANQSLVRSLENVDDIGNWNWCGFDHVAPSSHNTRAAIPDRSCRDLRLDPSFCRSG